MPQAVTNSMSTTKKRAVRNQPEAKTRILNVATRLFAERGFLGVSLRTIMSEAEVNVASAHYYFGSKEKLYEAMIMQFFPQVDKERRKMLADVTTKDQPSNELRLAQILRAYAIPHYRLLDDPVGAQYVRVIGRFLAEPPEMTKSILRKYLGDTRQLFIAALTDALPV